MVGKIKNSITIIFVILFGLAILCNLQNFCICRMVFFKEIAWIIMVGKDSVDSMESAGMHGFIDIQGIQGCSEWMQIE